jgi:hypothetical protein
MRYAAQVAGKPCHLARYLARVGLTLACVAPLYSLFELLGRRFPLDQDQDVAAPDQAGR